LSYSFNSPASTRFNFWDYDADTKGWFVYGHGNVSPDLSEVVPDAKTVIYEFTGAMVSQRTNAPAPSGPDGKGGGEPVDLATGFFMYQKTDLVLSDVTPIAFKRIYRSSDPISRAFGIGSSHDYDMFLVGDSISSPEGYTYQELIMGDGRRIHFSRTNSCDTGDGSCPAGTGIFTAFSPGSFYGATLRFAFNGWSGWTLTKKDGTVYLFPDSTDSGLSQAAALLGVRDRYGNTLTLTRDSGFNVTDITSPNGRWIQFTYDTSNRVTQALDNIGRKVIYTYDSAGRLFTVTDANNGLTTFTYDNANNILTINDARGITYLTNQYDGNGRVIKQTQADNSVFQFAYTVDANNHVTQTNVTDPNGNVEQVAFNLDSYVISDTFALGKPEQQTITYSRQTMSNLIVSTTDALGRQTLYSYDSMGNVSSITQLAGTANAVSTRFAYEPNFNELTAVADPLGHTTQFIYDSHGSLISSIDPLGNATLMKYNGAGQVVSISDPLGDTTQFSYDLGDLVQIIDPLARVTNRFVDSAGRLVATTDPFGQVTQLIYNPLNQTTIVTDPKGKQTVSAYDPNGNLLSVTDANNHSTIFTYNSMDRVATRKDALLNQESYGYDGNGNITTFTDRRGKVTTYTYDGLNRQTFAGFGTLAGPTYESSITYTIDAGNRLTKAVDSIGGTITRGNDGFDRLTSEVSPQGTASYTYDNAGRRATLTMSGQTVVNYTFDDANRPTQIVQGTGTVQIGYDVASRRTSLTLPNGIVTNYSYDNGSQLVSLNYVKGSSTLGSLTYGFDLKGRRSIVSGTYAGTNLPLAITSTAYNANNQLTTWGTANLFYDLNGNMTSDGTHSYAWDARNHLKQIDNGTTASFVYDPLGRRKSKTISGTTTTLLYDQANVVQEVIGANTANSLTGGVDEVFQRADSAGVRAFLGDALGSTVALTDNAGIVQTSYTFEPFGNTAASGTANSNTFAFTGRELDASNLNLYFYRARYYNPLLQRFISEDPLGFGANSVNFYELAYDSPTNYRDPSGMQTTVLEPIVGVGVAAGTATGAGVAAGAGASGFGPTLPLIVGGSAEGGAAGGPLGVAVGVVVGLGIYDGIQGHRLCQAYGICGPSPSPNPNPPLKPSTAGRGCKDKDKDADCEMQYENDSSVCRTLSDPNDRRRCWASAFQRYAQCLGGNKPSKPLEW
jgi:RHS repeat-associated protein